MMDGRCEFTYRDGARCGGLRDDRRHLHTGEDPTWRQHEYQRPRSRAALAAKKDAMADETASVEEARADYDGALEHLLTGPCPDADECRALVEDDFAILRAAIEQRVHAQYAPVVEALREIRDVQDETHAHSDGDCEYCMLVAAAALAGLKEAGDVE